MSVPHELEAAPDVAAKITIATAVDQFGHEVPTGKILSLDNDDKIKKTAANPARHICRTVTVNTAAELAVVLSGLRESQLVVAGWIPEAGNADYMLLSRSVCEATNLPIDQERPDFRDIENSGGLRGAQWLAKYFEPSAWLHIEYDFRSSIPDELAPESPDDWWSRLVKIDPGLAAVQCVITTSSSGRVKGAERCGYHAWIMIEDPDDKVRYLKALHQKMVVARLGYVHDSGKSESWHSLIDWKVGHTGRKIYSGPPAIECSGITLVEPPWLLRGQETVHDTASLFMTAEETRSYEAMKASVGGKYRKRTAAKQKVDGDGGKPRTGRMDLRLCAINDLSLPEAALAYAEQGLAVFPLQPGTKEPMKGIQWTSKATTDPGIIKAWWARWPDAGIGIPCGERSFDAADVDRKKGQDGDASLHIILDGDRLQLLSCPLQRTPSGGYHVPFLHTPGLSNFVGKGPHGGIDMKTTRGYVVVSPTKLAEGRYEWLRDGKLLPPPKKLLAAFREWSTPPVDSDRGGDMPDVPEVIIDYHTLDLDPRYLSYLGHGNAGPWDHNRSNAMFATAGALMRKLNDPGMVYGIMRENAYVMEVAKDHCKHGDPSRWLWRYGVRKILEQAGTKDATEVFNPIPGADEEEGTAVQDTHGGIDLGTLYEDLLRRAKGFAPDDTAELDRILDACAAGRLDELQVKAIVRAISGRRLGFTKMDLNKAVNKKREQAIAVQTGEAPLEFPHRNALGQPISHVENVRLIFQRQGVVLRQNLMDHKLVATIPGCQFLEDEVDNLQLIKLRDMCAEQGMSVNRVDEHVLFIAAESPYHPFENYLQGLPPWDGTDRVDGLLDTLKLTEGSDRGLARLLLERWLVSCIAAVKVEERSFPPRGVLTLVGPQAIGKTEFFRRLFPEGVFTDGSKLDLSSKDDKTLALSYLCTELGELEATFGKSDIAALKSFLSKETDEIRLPYARKASRWPRRTVFCGTCNTDDFLVDQTGNTRFWVIDIRGVHFDMYNTLDKDQLWAQVLQLWNEKTEYLLSRQELELLEMSNYARHREVPPEETRLRECLDWGTPKEAWDWLSLTEVQDRLDIKYKVNSREQRNLREALKRLTEAKDHAIRRIPVYLVPPKRMNLNRLLVAVPNNAASGPPGGPTPGVPGGDVVEQEELPDWLQ